MIKFFSYLLLGYCLLASKDLFASLRYRSATDILTPNSEAIELRFQSFSKKTSFDEGGAELVLPGSFSVNELMSKYTRGLLPYFEASFMGKFRNVKSESPTSNASNSGIDSIGAEGKYLFFKNQKIKNALALRFKKALFKNTHYDSLTQAPVDKVVLGDDGLEYGLDYLVTYYDRYLNYDFKFGYNKPSSDLSSELLYNAEFIYSFRKVFLLAGIGGIYSLKNDSYSNSPTTKPNISNGNSRLFNSINREQVYFYGGAEYAIGDFIIGLKDQVIFKARSSDTGNTISLNVRWERNDSSNTSLMDIPNYFAEGFVEKISSSGNILKINIGSDHRLSKGDYIDVFNINDYNKVRPIAKGTVFEVGPNWSIVRLNSKSKQFPIKIAYLVKAY